MPTRKKQRPSPLFSRPVGWDGENLMPHRKGAKDAKENRIEIIATKRHKTRKKSQITGRVTA